MRVLLAVVALWLTCCALHRATPDPPPEPPVHVEQRHCVSWWPMDGECSPTFLYCECTGET